MNDTDISRDGQKNGAHGNGTDLTLSVQERNGNETKIFKRTRNPKVFWNGEEPEQKMKDSYGTGRHLPFRFVSCNHFQIIFSPQYNIKIDIVSSVI